MLTAVENFGGEQARKARPSRPQPKPPPPPRPRRGRPGAGGDSTQAATTTAPTTTAAKPVATKVQVSETEFKITTDLTSFKAGEITFVAKNDGKIPHDLAVKETGDKTKEISPGGTAELKVNLKPGKYELYCTIPGHEAAGMKLTITVS
jgi:uncharacterized cupredoxin-like copper-binding protein